MGVSPKKEYFFSILQRIKKRPEMYIQPVSLQSLNNFLTGFICCNLYDNEEGDYLNKYPSFYDWIAMKESSALSPSNSWLSVISENTANDKEAFDRFFEHFDSYLAREPKVIDIFELSENDRNKAIDSDDGFYRSICRIEVVSYDSACESAFVKLYDKSSVQVGNEYYFEDLSSALEYLKNTFNLAVS